MYVTFEVHTNLMVDDVSCLSLQLLWKLTFCLVNVYVFETFFVLCSEIIRVIRTSRLVLMIFNLFLGDLILSKVIAAAHGDLHTPVPYTML